MPGSFKTEGIVLRSIRYGEADRILHLYTPTRGRVNAIAKGSRKPRSRFGGRLEPFFRLDLVLYSGRSDLATVTAASTRDGYGQLRCDGASIDAAARACDALLRLLDSGDPNRPAYNLLCHYLTGLDSGEVSSGVPTRLAFRLKLALATGFAPELASCARCGEADGLAAFSGAAGGVVCGACEAGGFELTAEAHSFMTAALARPLADAPAASERALNQVSRAISSTLEHHANVMLRRPAA